MPRNPAPTSGTLVLTRSDVAGLLDYEACEQAVETAFRLLGEGAAADPAIAGVHVDGGGFHVKAGVLRLGRHYFAAKTNANFPGNRDRRGLPTIQGTIVLHDADNGYPLALMDSIEVSIRRTGAATAVAARRCARPDAQTVAVAGCGEQGRAQLRALARARRLTRVVVYDIDSATARGLADELAPELGVGITVAPDFRAAAREADVVVTCTPSSEYLLGAADIAPGTFVAGVGVDNPHKRELAPDLLARALVVADVIDQSATIGDLHHAIEAGVVTRDHVYAELGEIVAGRKPGRRGADDVVVFDSTGMALQDVAAAAVVYERAVAQGVGHRLPIGA